MQRRTLIVATILAISVLVNTVSAGWFQRYRSNLPTRTCNCYVSQYCSEVQEKLKASQRKTLSKYGAVEPHIFEKQLLQLCKEVKTIDELIPYLLQAEVPFWIDYKPRPLDKMKRKGTLKIWIKLSIRSVYIKFEKGSRNILGADTNDTFL